MLYNFSKICKLYKLPLRITRGAYDQPKLEKITAKIVHFRLNLRIVLLWRIRHRDESTERISERVG